jgi:hypothetical protein
MGSQLKLQLPEKQLAFRTGTLCGDKVVGQRALGGMTKSQGFKNVHAVFSGQAPSPSVGDGRIRPSWRTIADRRSTGQAKSHP